MLSFDLVTLTLATLLCPRIDALIVNAPVKTPEWDDYNHYKTEPTFRANRVVITNQTDNVSLLQPGYIFIATFAKAGDPYTGPQILDSRGELVWNGNASTNGGRVQNFHACNYMGNVADHLCWSEADFSPMVGIRSWNRILNNTYHPMGRPYGATGWMQPPNPHEFTTTRDGKTFLQSVYQSTERDLTQYLGGRPGYIDDGCFQEVDIESGNPVFQWCALQHIELWHTYIYLSIEGNPNATDERYGDGTFHKPWDYFHLNSVEKNDEGDYYISARHLNCIFKIAGNDNQRGLKPGEIIWRLGGRLNDFAGVEEVDISRQHHVRELNMTREITTLSFFNNQWQTGPNLTRGSASNAKIVTINNRTMKVESAQKFDNPESLISLAQGAAQVLPNGNMFVGWGTVPQISEFAPDGTLLSHMHIGGYRRGQKLDEGVVNYRASKQDWVGRPPTKPKLLPYTFSCDSGHKSPLYAYVSWNGATQVARWKFFASRWSEHGPWVPAGNFRKVGFETKVSLLGAWGTEKIPFRKYVMVQALDAAGHVLESATAITFVPNRETKSGCDEYGCLPVTFLYEEGKSCAGRCDQKAPPVAYGALVMVVLIIEYSVIIGRRKIFLR